MAQAKGQRDGMVLSSRTRRRPLSSGEIEGVSWRGPRTIFFQKNLQGFGFTLRHFIVYPPESSLHSLKDEENGNLSGKGCQRSHLEPMDTIFVKSVKENGPAHQAGLCTGDRLVKVNGESVLGKTYSQVIALIQNSEDILELCIMPKDEDVLQLAYSQDAYLKGNEPYTGEAQNLPEPPPLCYISTKTGSSPHSLLDNCRTSVTSPLDNRPLAASTPSSGPSRAPEESSSHRSSSKQHRGRSSSTISALEFHFANHNAAIASATLPLPRKSSLPTSARTHTNVLCNQALSDWYYNQAEATERMSPRHYSTSQEHLAELGLGLTFGPRHTATSIISTKQHQRENLQQHHQAAAASHDSYWLGDWGRGSGPGNRLCSQSLLAAYSEYEHNYGRSVETLAEASALVSQHYDRTPQSSQMTKFSEQKVPGEHQHQAAETASCSTPPSGRQSGQQVAEPQTRRLKDEELVGYKSYSPSFSHKAGHLLQLSQSFREPSYTGPHLNWHPGSRTDSDGEIPSLLQSPPAQPASEEEKVQLREDRIVVSPISLTQKVVLRQKLPADRRKLVQTTQHPNYAISANSPELPDWSPSSGTPSPLPVVTDPSRRANGGLAQHALDSLSSIPFIGSIKSRRSSYLLAITTERSVSCDEGLNTFREEGRVFSKLPKRVKSFFTDRSLENLRDQEEARSKRHSTSELGTITVSDVRKEGWLHYKQILTEKGKKLGGSIRLWKRVFAVLRHHSLFLYKDKREAVLHGAGAGPCQDEHSPISILGCLIDIAYSETKRKHTLRLTTQDFCEYLLQAEDRDDMLAWIRVIREGSKSDNEEIGFSRHALINKKLKDYRKHSLTGNKLDSSPRAHRMIQPFLLVKTDNTLVNRAIRSEDSKALWGINIMKKNKKADTPKAFGVRLEDCQPAVHHKFVPLIVEMCCGVVEAIGLEYTGIYRVPGNNAMVSNLQEHLNKGLDINTAEERCQDLNVISSLLKSFFRKLPEPLFTDDKYIEFINANRIEDAEERLKTMKKLIHNLPDHYYHTLRFLVGHLKRVADHSEKNKMEPRNLALVFGPTLVRTSEDNMTDMVTHMPDRYKIVETLITHYDWFFRDGELRREGMASEKKQDQPRLNIDHLLTNIGRPGMPGETSDSTTSGSVKLRKSIISAVTRKRKKCLSTHLAGSSDDEDSEHEPIKTTNYDGEEKGGEEDGERGKKEPDKGVSTCSKKDKRQENVVMAADTGEENGADSCAKHHPVSCLCSHDQTSATHSRPPPATNNPSYLRSHSTASGHPIFPLWISPSRPPNLHRASGSHSSQQPDWSQAASINYRKTRGGRIRATSMNLDLDLGLSKDRDRSWWSDRMEVIRVSGSMPPQRGFVVGSSSAQQTDPFLLSSSSGWIDSGSQEFSSVVMRRSAHDQRDKTRVWRRHTVVV